MNRRQLHEIRARPHDMENSHDCPASARLELTEGNDCNSSTTMLSASSHCGMVRPNVFFSFELSSTEFFGRTARTGYSAEVIGSTRARDSRPRARISFTIASVNPNQDVLPSDVRLYTPFTSAKRSATVDE